MKGLKPSYKVFKRGLDIFISMIAILFSWWLFIPLIVISALSTKSSGIFKQKRIGSKGIPFTIYKIQTYHSKTKLPTKIGSFFRKHKLDELPQLFQVLFGTMSLVGPRPDIPGYADKLQGTDRNILTLKPGLTGLASIAFRNEDALLKSKPNPLEFNDSIIWPRKVKLNMAYFENYNYCTDLYLIWRTVFGK